MLCSGSKWKNDAVWCNEWCKFTKPVFFICCSKLSNAAYKWTGLKNNTHTIARCQSHKSHDNIICYSFRAFQKHYSATPTLSPSVVLSLLKSRLESWKEWESEKHHLKQIASKVTTLSRISSGVLTSQCDPCVAQSHDQNRSGQRSMLMDGDARESASCQCAWVCVFEQFYGCRTVG